MINELKPNELIVFKDTPNDMEIFDRKAYTIEGNHYGDKIEAPQNEILSSLSTIIALAVAKVKKQIT